MFTSDISQNEDAQRRKLLRLMAPRVQPGVCHRWSILPRNPFTPPLYYLQATHGLRDKVSLLLPAPSPQHPPPVACRTSQELERMYSDITLGPRPSTIRFLHPSLMLFPLLLRDGNCRGLPAASYFKKTQVFPPRYVSLQETTKRGRLTF